MSGPIIYALAAVLTGLVAWHHPGAPRKDVVLRIIGSAFIGMIWPVSLLALALFDMEEFRSNDH